MSGAIDSHLDSLWGKAASLEEIKKMLMPRWTVVVVELDKNFYCYHPALFLGNRKERNNENTLKRRIDEARTIFGFFTNITTIEGK
jgi:hypothetical protein